MKKMSFFLPLFCGVLTILGYAQTSVGGMNNIRYADQFPSVQAAINSLPSSGGTVIVPAGIYSGPTNIPRSSTTVKCATWLGCTFTYNHGVLFGSSTSFISAIALDGIVFDFGGHNAGLTLTGMQSSFFRIKVQNSGTAAALTLTATALRTNFYNNDLEWIDVENAGIGLVLNGDQNLTGCGGSQISNGGAVYGNRFGMVSLHGISGSYGLQLTSGVDSNTFAYTFITMGGENTTGNALALGTRCPTSYGDIDLNIFRHLTIDAAAAGYTGPMITMSSVSKTVIDGFVAGVNARPITSSSSHRGRRSQSTGFTRIPMGSRFQPIRQMGSSAQVPPG